VSVVFIISRFFDDTRPFVRAAAATPGLSVTLVRGDEDPGRAMRTLGRAARIWFEGGGPALSALAARPGPWRFAKAYLRAGADEADALPWHGLWNVVSDLVVPGPRTAEAALAATAAARQVPGRIHLADFGACGQAPTQPVPAVRLARLADLLFKPPGGLLIAAWRAIRTLGEVSRGRALVLGAAPPELPDHLRRAHGLEVIGSSDDAAPADTVIVWAALGGDQGRGAAASCAAEVLRRAQPGVTVAAVAAEESPDAAAGPAALRRTLEALLAPTGLAFEFDVRGSVVVAACGPGRRAFALLQEHGHPSAGSLFSAAEGMAPAEPPRAGASAGPPPGVEVSAEPPLVSAVIPVYNDARRIGRAIAGLRGQTWRNLEILVVDDGSTDGTAEAVAKHLDDPRVRYLYKEHSGRPETRNLGVREARGDFIAWLGSDDESLPNRIRLQVQAAAARPGTDIVHSDGFFFAPDGSLHRCRRYRPFTAQELPGLLLAGFGNVCPILDTSALIRRDLYQRLGGYDPQFLRCQDYDFYIRTAMAGDVTYAHVPEPLVKVSQSPGSPDRLAAGLDFYLVLARRLIEFFGPERLMDGVARDLQEHPCLFVARCLVEAALTFDAPPDHGFWSDARSFAGRVAAEGSPDDRADSDRLLAFIVRRAGAGEGPMPRADRAPCGTVQTSPTHGVGMDGAGRSSPGSAGGFEPCHRCLPRLPAGRRGLPAGRQAGP